MIAGGTQLLERTDELAAIDDALRAAEEEIGAITLVEGPPGIGKTELLAAAIARARSRHMLVLSARSGELELSFPHAVVRQLFERAVTRAEPALRDRVLSGAAAHARGVVDPRFPHSAATVDASAVLHGLYWLTANLAADRPVLLVVDDLHWCDAVSMSWLLYLARRIDGLPVTLIGGARPVEPGADDALFKRLRATDGLRRIQPAPLSIAAVDALARAALSEHVHPAFSAACHTSTGGNPFYIAELLRALRHDGVAGTADDVATLAGLTPTAVIDATLARLGRSSDEARAVAEAVAVLEPHAELRWIAALTGLDIDAVALAADDLLKLGVLRSIAPCRFEHPILRSAVESQVSPARRGRLHLNAAQLLTDAQMPADTVAAHLMRTPPLGEAWIVSILRDAGRRAGARGAPAGAAAYLQRALAERPPAPERRALLLELGKAESQINSAQAPHHLREALALAEHPDEIAEVALWLGQALYHSGALDEAFALLGDVVERIEGFVSDVTLELEAYLVSIATTAGRMVETAKRARTLEARTPPSSSAAGAVQATLAFRDMFAGRPREHVRTRAERALSDIDSPIATGTHLSDRQAPGSTLLWIDELERATELFTKLLTAAAKAGRMQTFEIFAAMRGFTVHRRGDLANAAADIEPILAAAPDLTRPGFAELVALITQVHLLVDRGRADEAARLASATQVPPGFERGHLAVLLLHAQSTAQLAQHKHEQAAATLTLTGELCDATGIRSPAVIPWRSDLALALAGTHRHDEAIGLAWAELRLADECDIDRARGHALRALGLLEGAEAGLEHLDAAVTVLTHSPARLELGWANYELGAALRRANRRRDARAPLDRALDLALACGATLLVQRAGEELQALGARPRSVLLTGAESLTPSERRVCRLAAQGLKNAEIAQALFVSLKTVETHLGNSYRKLDISSRIELADALDPIFNTEHAKG